MSPNSNTTVPRRTLPNEIRYADLLALIYIVDFTGVYVLYLVLAVGLPEPYVPYLLLPVMFLLPLLNHPLPLGLKLIRSLPHTEIPTAIQDIDKN
jgi:hypothetical protein